MENGPPSLLHLWFCLTVWIPSVPESLNEAGSPEVLEPFEGDTKKRRVESFSESVDWCQREMSFERGVQVNFATGWNMSDEEQMKEVKQLVCDEEPVLLIGSPTYRAFSTLFELTLAGKTSEVRQIVLA